MGQYGISSQGCTLTLSGSGGTAGPFGGTVITQRRVYSNADTTTTYSTVADEGNAWDEHVPITRGALYDVEVPFKSDVNIDSIDDFFDSTCYGDNPSPMQYSVDLPAAEGGDTLSGDCILESHDTTMAAKDAMRLKFTIKLTGPIAVN